MKDKLISIVDKFKSKKVLVIGDIMLDEYHWCDVSRISPEAPVPVCSVNKTTLVPGGAGNVALNIETLGANVLLAGTIGNDSSGDKLITILNKHNINTEGLIRDDEKPTILKSRIIAHQQQMVRVDRENNDDITQSTRNKLFKFIESQITTLDAILISDYAKGTLPETFIQRIISLANTENKIVVIDPKGDNYTKYKGAFTLTPNFKEFTTVIKKSLTSEKDIADEAIKLVKRLNLNALLITRSEKGMSIISRDLEKIDIPTQAKEVYDITGAGDTVIATLTLALSSGTTMETAAQLANIAAGLVVAKVGTSTISPEELETELQS